LTSCNPSPAHICTEGSSETAQEPPGPKAIAVGFDAPSKLSLSSPECVFCYAGAKEITKNTVIMCTLLINGS